MISKYLKLLEFDKILQMAQQHITCPEAAELLLSEEKGANADEVRFMLQKTNTITTLLLKNGHPRLSGIAGVDKTVNRSVKGGVLSMKELLDVGYTLRNFQALVNWYALTEHDEYCVDDLFYALTTQPALEKNIFEAIISENEMADNASDTLYDLRRKIRAAENSIRDKLDSVVRSQNAGKVLQESVVSMRNGRYVVPVKSEYRGEVSGVIHDVSSTGATVFVEPTAVVEANAKIMQLKSQELIEIERILAAFSAQLAGIAELFELSWNAMLQIDVLLAKGQLACAQNGMLPTVRADHCFKLIHARHPLIDKTKVVPIDLSLGGEYDTLVITGPNTGGKTVTLKTAGLLCAMAQHGFLIPAHETSEICVFDKILVDIGDEQSIEQSLSTFSGHIKNITEIMKQIGTGSLVLMDELGAGTDPAEGAALAVSVIETMRSAGAKIMATTHYAELKMFALDTKGVQNASCEFNVETLQPTYKINVGVPGKSNAFLISEKLGLDIAVIDRARQHLSTEDRQFDSILSQVEDLKTELKERQEEIGHLQNAAQYELEKAEKKRAELVRQGEIELEAARNKAQAMVKDVQNTAYNLMDEMKKLEKDSATSANMRAQRAREIARKDTEKLFAQSDIVHQSELTFVPLEKVTVGQQVSIPSLSLQGVVLSLPDKNNMVDIRAGVVKTKVPLTGLCAVSAQPPKPKKHTPVSTGSRQSVAGQSVRNASMEINLIGMNVEEALHEVDKFIDNGVMSGQSMLYLIHGKGAGILRKAIHEHLKHHRSIKSYRLGTFGEGEAGVTVVEIK